MIIIRYLGVHLREVSDLLLAQANAIQTAMTASRGVSNKGPNEAVKTALDSLATAGTITQAQENAIQGS